MKHEPTPKKYRTVQPSVFEKKLSSYIKNQASPFMLHQAARHLGIEDKKLTRDLMTRIGAALRKLGCEKVIYRFPLTDARVAAWINPAKIDLASPTAPLPQSLLPAQESQLCKQIAGTDQPPHQQHHQDRAEISPDQNPSGETRQQKAKKKHRKLPAQLAFGQSSLGPRNSPIIIEKLIVMIGNGKRKGE